MRKALGLNIVDGRTQGDSLGRFTYCSVLGNGVIDYAITDLYPENMNAFTVLPSHIRPQPDLALEKRRDPYP